MNSNRSREWIAHPAIQRAKLWMISALSGWVKVLHWAFSRRRFPHPLVDTRTSAFGTGLEPPSASRSARRSPWVAPWVQVSLYPALQRPHKTRKSLRLCSMLQRPGAIHSGVRSVRASHKCVSVGSSLHCPWQCISRTQPESL